MLLLHQTGILKIGEVVRYTVTYTPSADRILPSPHALHLKLKNTSAIALRAAFVHGPYTLYAAAYPKGFHPNERFERPGTYGVPEFEPNLKAGGTFSAQLAVPEDVRGTAGGADWRGNSAGSKDDGEGEGGKGSGGGRQKSVSWIIEVSSQVVFSNSAAVHYELLLGRDEKSLSMGLASGLTGTGEKSLPGQVGDLQGRAQELGMGTGRSEGPGKLPKGVFSRAITVKVDDTASLWNTPRMPEWNDQDSSNEGDKGHAAPAQSAGDFGKGNEEGDGHRTKRQKKVHLVVLTHGLHSNLGADMLFLKESIDEAAKQAKIDARIRKAKKKQERGRSPGPDRDSTSAENDTQGADEGEDEDEEEVIVRGFSGNCVRTEKGIKYLGKRLAKYVLLMTYPDQPYKPVTKKSAASSLSHAMRPEHIAGNSAGKARGQPSHDNSGIIKAPQIETKLAYKFTSISFIGHSLGGLIQTYAVAYIQKHSPEFFDLIEPINFIAMASPFLGLSNENPMYVKFALDFGLVGRTGKDLGLTWRAPTIARSGWGAIVGGIGESAHKGESAPEAKPLLRILPTGPAHVVLKKFRNRTVYSNVVNDGVVPLRTSCLLFLDWQGLGRVEKARRDNGLVGTMASWGWAEITGANSSSPSRRAFTDGVASDTEETGVNTPTTEGHGGDVPQPSPYATLEDDVPSPTGVERPPSAGAQHSQTSSAEPTNNVGPLASIMKFFNPASSQGPKHHNDHSKHTKIYRRSQTLRMGSETDAASDPSIATQDFPPKKNSRGKATTGDEEDPERLLAPPKTTFFESAGDIIKPPLPPTEFIINPSSRARTIFHDRVYHPEDIPPPPLKKRPIGRRSSFKATEPSPTGPKHTDSALSTQDYDDTRHTNPDKDPRDVIDGSAMKVEEKIARAYHRDLSWRKVLVRLEPDAHNNMVVRRMFANAYGWPVIKHLCDTHFGDSEAANTRDEDETNADRARDTNEGPAQDGGETNVPETHDPLEESGRTDSEVREAIDSVPDMSSPPRPGRLGRALTGNQLTISLPSPGGGRKGESESETTWSDRDWADSEFDSDDCCDTPATRPPSGGWNWTEAIAGKGTAASPRGTEPSEIDRFLGHKRFGTDGASDMKKAGSPERKVDLQLAAEADADAVPVPSTGEAPIDSGGVLLDAVGRLQVGAADEEASSKEEGIRVGEDTR
ncbi:hypothetical protein LZ554_005753 [Drepanopeziza brunnea f. sp. 'monogermtubi']|nr:hypothetical protein LZ554_005753 [Drepanopeziza brunnea f. sp. 'monogermtubi']